MSGDPNPEPFSVHYDGLRDEQGLIPAFGPVKLDEQGRLIMSEGERRARMAAGVRALKALSRLPDSDPPGVEEQFMRNYDESHPHRPQFEGYY